MSIAGVVRNDPDPGELPSPPSHQIPSAVCAERASLVLRMLGALGTPRGPVVSSAGTAIFGASDGGATASDPVDRILVSANGSAHSVQACEGGSRPGPAEAVLAAYRQYGENFPLNLCGDFSCAIWDGLRRRLILAADLTDNCGLFFCRIGNSVVFSSDPREILSDRSIPREIDQEYMLSFLCDLPLDTGATFFRSIGRVLPGHLTVFDLDVSGGTGIPQPQRKQWWHPDCIPTLRLPDHPQYAEALRCELDRATSCRLPREGNAGIFLSSGLDSTAIAALAARRLAAQGRLLTACTLVYSSSAARIQDSGWFSDEFPLASRMARAWPNIVHYRVLPEDIRVVKAIEISFDLRGVPQQRALGAATYLSLLRFAANAGLAGILTGGFGNFTISYDGRLAALKLRREGRFGRLAAQMAGLRRHGLGWKPIAARLISDASFRSLRRLAGKKEPLLFDSSPINPHLARSSGALDRVRAAAEARASVSGRFLIGEILSGQRSGYAREAFLRSFGLVPTSPAGDRRVFELCLSIPEEQFEWGGRPRQLIRTAMQGLVPDEILNERRRGVQGLGWESRFQADLPEIVREVDRIAASTLANRFLDVPRIRRLCDRWSSAPPAPGAADREYLTVLLRGLAVGTFLRRFESGSSSPAAFAVFSSKPEGAGAGAAPESNS